jgi:hypothetical protein
MQSYDKSKLFLSALKLKDKELLKVLNPVYYNWLYHYYNPFTPRIDSYWDIPFYNQFFHKDYLGFFSMIYRKNNFLKFEYPQQELEIWHKGELKLPYFFYPCEDNILVALCKSAITTNKEVEPKILKGLKHPMLKGMYVIGDGGKWITYVSETEWRGRKSNDTFQLRLELLRVLLGDKRCITGYRVDSPINGIGLIGQENTTIFEMERLCM